MKILVADDNRDITDSFGLLLEVMGFEVETAYDGLQACEKAQTFRPEAALLDIRMPGKHGYAVAEYLRDLGSLKGGCLIAMTGEGGPDALQRAKEAGFNHLLFKPTSVAAIVKLLEDPAEDIAGTAVS